MTEITSRFHQRSVIFAWHAGWPSDRNCPTFSSRRSPLSQQRCYDVAVRPAANVEPDTRRPLRQPATHGTNRPRQPCRRSVGGGPSDDTMNVMTAGGTSSSEHGRRDVKDDVAHLMTGNGVQSAMSIQMSTIVCTVKAAQPVAE